MYCPGSDFNNTCLIPYLRRMPAAKFLRGGVASCLCPQGAPQRPSTSPRTRATRAARPRPGRGTPGRVPRGPHRPRRCWRVPQLRPAPRHRTLSRHPLPRPARRAPGSCQRLARAGSGCAERSGQPRPLRPPPCGPAAAAAAAGDLPTHFMQNVRSCGAECMASRMHDDARFYDGLMP